jgi:hypothetical protein
MESRPMPPISAGKQRFCLEVGLRRLADDYQVCADEIEHDEIFSALDRTRPSAVQVFNLNADRFLPNRHQNSELVESQRVGGLRTYPHLYVSAYSEPE